MNLYTFKTTNMKGETLVTHVIGTNAKLELQIALSKEGIEYDVNLHAYAAHNAAGIADAVYRINHWGCQGELPIDSRDGAEQPATSMPSRHCTPATPTTCTEENSMKIPSKVKCAVRGHQFEAARAYLLPARQCRRCGLRQVKVPDVGGRQEGWIDSRPRKTS